MASIFERYEDASHFSSDAQDMETVDWKKPEEETAESKDLPAPPYNEKDDPAAGLACYLPGCKFIGSSWDGIMQHLRAKHKIKMASPSLQGSYLHKMAKKEINKKQQQRYKTKAQTGSKQVKKEFLKSKGGAEELPKIHYNARQ